MAFTTDQRLDICDILKITPDALNSQIIYLGDRLTVEIETKILAKVAQWPSVSGNFASFTPTESNKGFNLSSSSQKSAVQESIANWLELEGYGSTNQILIERG